MKKILIIFTGGTIESKSVEKTINIDSQQGYVLLEKFKEKSILDVEFTIAQPTNILSENCTPKEWIKIIATIKNVNTSDFDGIIITHGSDTLPYTAALISYVFANTKIPIILTASNYPLDYLGSNGLANFISSVEFICYSGTPGIFVVFKNDKNETKLYFASRMMEINPIDDQFPRYGGAELGTLVNGFLPYDVCSSLINKIVTREKSLEMNIACFNNDVLFIRPYPGLNYNLFKFNDKKPRAILHGLYHSATACVNGIDNSLIEYIQYCKENNIDFYIPLFRDIDADLYSTTKELLKYGVIPLQNITIEAAIVKLWLAYNIGLKNPQEFVLKNIYFEFIVQ